MMDLQLSDPPSDVGQIWGGEVSGLHDFIYIFIFSGKFAVLPTHGLAGDKLVPAGSPGDPLHPGGVRDVHRGPGVHACGNGAGFDSSSPLALYPVKGGGGALHALWGGGGPTAVSLSLVRRGCSAMVVL